MPPGRRASKSEPSAARRSLLTPKRAAAWRRSGNAPKSALKATLGAAQLPIATFEVDADEQWRTAWTEHLRPIALTRRLVLAPTTAPPPPLRPAQQLILYQPALAFGDGDHATTRLASRAIERHYKKAPGGALLDIGAGTGVLSFVAIRSGARRALGIDIAAEAVQAAQTNAALNGIAKEARFVPTSARVSGKFDLAVINIELRPLASSAEQAAYRRTARAEADRHRLFDCRNAPT